MKKLILVLALLALICPFMGMKLYLTNTSSSGQTQSDPNASLGGYRSTTELSTTSMKNLFDDVSVVEALLGDTEYRMIDVYNDGTGTAYGVQLYMQTATSSDSTELNFGYSATNQPHADAWNGEALSNESTAPASPSMSFANYTKTSPLSLGTIPASQSKRVCVRRTVTAGAPWTAHDLGRFGVRWGVEAAGASYLVNEGFEGTEGAAPGVPSGWTAIGTTGNCDYTTSPIAGSQSMYIPTSSGTYNGAYVSFSGASTIYAAGKFTLPATITEVDDNTFIEFRTSGGTSLCKVMLVWYTNHIHVSLKAGAGTKVNDSTIELAATSTYSWWFDYTADGGSNNGTGNFYLVADSNTKPTVLLTVSDGDVDGNPAQLALENRYTAAKFDSILVDDADIGNLQ